MLQHAIAYVEDGRFYGAKATMNVWKPQIQDTNEFSLSQIWVLGGTFDLDLNSIEAGWQVLFSNSIVYFRINSISFSIFLMFHSIHLCRLARTCMEITTPDYSPTGP